MEQHFLGFVKPVSDSAEVDSEDCGPWSLPLYPVLREYSLDSCDLGLLSGPCWRLPGVYPQNGLFPGVQGTLEPSTAQPAEFSVTKRLHLENKNGLRCAFIAGCQFLKYLLLMNLPCFRSLITCSFHIF
uniref:Uncharacterized protein n=1 Tax=Theropithecus gelada TaxID=9565 RepID=A0A8D2EX49_THEGE